MNSILISISRDFLFVLASYIVGSIPFCYIIGKLAGGKRLTEIGDKNPGGWNLAFNVSKIWGAVGTTFDVAKGYFAYFLAYKLISQNFITFLGTNENQLIAILAGCSAVAGHNYSPFLKFKGGKGIATWFGFMLAASPWTIPVAAVGFLFGIFVARNMIWSVSLAIILTGIFLWLFKNNYIFVLMIILNLLIMISKQINRTLTFKTNLKFRKEATLQDLFKPKIR